MRNCSYPGCPRDAYGQRCYYHDKVVGGLISRDDVLLVRVRHVAASAVVSDEQTDLVSVALALGADPRSLKDALCRS